MYLTQLLLSHSDSHAHLHVLLRFLSACALSVQMFGRPSSARASAGSSTRCSPALLSSSLWPRLPSPSSSAVGFPPSVFFFGLSSAKIHLSLHSSCRRLIRKREAGGEGGREVGGVLRRLRQKIKRRRHPTVFEQQPENSCILVSCPLLTREHHRWSNLACLFTHMPQMSVPSAVEHEAHHSKKKNLCFSRNKENNFFFFFLSLSCWCYVTVGFGGKLAHHTHEHVNFIFSRERQQHINCYMGFYPTAAFCWVEFKRCWRLEAAERGSDEEKRRLRLPRCSFNTKSCLLGLWCDDL